MAYQILYLKDVPELKSRRGNAITPLLAVILGVNYPLTEAVACYEWQDGSVTTPDDFEAVGSLLGDPNVGRWIRVDLSQIPQINADWNATSGPSLILNKPTPLQGVQGPPGPQGIQGIQGVSGTPGTTFQRTRVQTNTSGLYTWTFQTPFSSGVTPIIQVTVEDSADAAWNHRIYNLSNTGVTIQLGKLTATTLLGISLLQIVSNPQAYIHIQATAP